MFSFLRALVPEPPREPSPAPLRRAVEAFCHSPAAVAAAQERVRVAFLSRSRYASRPKGLSAADLELLFGLYDGEFFGGALAESVEWGGDDTKLSFRVSSRMTSAAGKLYARLPRRGRGPVRYEIALSGHLLELNFRGGRGAEVNGLACRDRADALMRVFEHELLHLVERLLTGTSSCRKAPFKALAARFFGHADVTHRLDTPRTKARDLLGLSVGDPVRFSHAGRSLAGRINRIGKRVTVLVPDERGTLYTDRRRYRKFYVPLSLLSPDAQGFFPPGDRP